VFDAEAFQAFRRGQWGTGLQWHREAGSTQDLARAAEKSAGLVIGAETQTAGRGRWGRQWEGAAGQSLMFTLVLPAQGMLSQAPLVLGVGLAQSLALQLRWPNDLCFNGKKVAGLLVEQEGDWLLAGLGLNVGQGAGDFSPGIQATASSLKLAGSPELRREPLLATLLLGMEAAWTQWKHQGFEVLRKDWEALAEGMGQAVKVQPTSGEAWQGTMEGLDGSGALRVKASDGTLRSVASAEVQRLSR
jgi:BirA family biotin operon repressor/biotin-[acetyl-CoA-carboxylase] ligase